MASIKQKTDKNGNVIYQVQASNGRGRRVWRTFRPEPTWSKRTIQRELQRFAAELESQLEGREVLTREENLQKAAEQALEAAKIKTLRQYAESVYLPEKAASVAEKTRASYAQLLEQHVYPALGDVPMTEITPAMIKALLSSLPEKFAFASRVKVYAVLHGMFKSAVMDDTLNINPMDKVPRPRQSKDAAVSAEHKAFTAEETRYILHCLENEPLKWRAFVLLLIDTGCRRGEACGLQWQAVDLDAGTITIERNLQYTSARGVYETLPKNGKTRIVDISQDVVELLQELRQTQPVTVRWVFTQEDSPEPMHPDTPTRYFQRFGRRYGIEHFHPHKLRHTSASLAITGGADVVSVAARLGHSDSSTTLRMYAHANQESIRRAGQTVREALRETAEKKA
ncbi:MAG: tyrosine-type recombinase/integrase [Faecalibacterium sp.]